MKRNCTPVHFCETALLFLRGKIAKWLNDAGEAKSEAKIYLQVIADTTANALGAELGVQITWSVEEGQNIADEPINVAELGDSRDVRKAYVVIALATHGRGEFQRWMLGSVTERVLDSTKLSLLIVRPQEVQASATGGQSEEEAQSKLNPLQPHLT